MRCSILDPSYATLTELPGPKGLPLLGNFLQLDLNQGSIISDTLSLGISAVRVAAHEILMRDRFFDGGSGGTTALGM